MGQRGAASALPQNAGEGTASDVGNALGAETGGEPIPGARRDAIQGTHPFALTSGDVREPDLQGPRLVRPATVHVTQTKLRHDLLTRGDTLPLAAIETLIRHAINRGSTPRGDEYFPKIGASHRRAQRQTGRRF